MLANSIPPQLINAFRVSIAQKKSLSFKPEAQLTDLFTLLQSWQKREPHKPKNHWLPWRKEKASPVANLVTLGDAWLATAIQEQLIQPFQLQNLSEWEKLSPRWQELVKRDEKGYLDAKGQIWALPYRWGVAVIAYRRDKFKSLGWTPTDWGDLWREDVKRLISLVDHPRLVIGLTLKKLGYSYNTFDLKEIPNLEAELIKLNQQVKYYSSNHYLEPLILGDTWLAVGWSGDILPLQEQNPDIEVVIPVSGTCLTADLWVQPASLVITDNQAELTQQWIDFCWQIKGITAISLLSNGISPMISNVNLGDLPKQIRENPLVVNYNSILEKSEFLNPLPQTTVKQYEQLWTKMRQG
jgi:putative spermidine/putrescine transport system substrate-binding protein